MDKLPQEIIKYILHFLEPRLLDLARSVCSDWFKIIDKRSFNLYCLRNGELAALENIFSRYKAPFELIFKKPTLQFARDAQFPKCLARLTNLTSLSLVSYINPSWLALTTLSKLQQLKLEDPPMGLIEKLPQLNKLHFVRAFQFMASLHVFTLLTALQDLKITFADQEDYSGLFSALTNPSLLTRLKLNGSNMSDYTAIQRFYNMKHLTLDYWSTKFEEEEPFPLKFSALASLTVSGTNVSIEDITTNTTLTHLELSTSVHPSFQNFSRLSKLRTLALIAPNEIVEEEMEFLTSLSTLNKLTLEAPSATGKFSAHLSTNITSLTFETFSCEDLEWMRLENLRVLNLTANNPEQNENFFLNLQKLSKLTRLALTVHSLSTEIVQKLPSTLCEMDLSTSATSVVDIDFERLKELNMVHLHNVILDPLSLVKLADLTALKSFSANWWQPELVALSNLQQLTYLKLIQYDAETPQAILPLLTNLRNLCVTPLSDNAIRQLTTLKHLTFLMCMRLESEGYALTCLTSLQRIIASPNLKNSKECT
jgi:hypothetical protein